MANDRGTMATMEQTAGFEDRDETVLASPGVQAAVDGATWTGTAEVVLECGPGPTVSLECLFDEGIEPDHGAVTVREPGRVKRLLVEGKLADGRGTRATFFDDDDGAKVLADLGLRGVEA